MKFVFFRPMQTQRLLGSLIAYGTGYCLHILYPINVCNVWFSASLMSRAKRLCDSWCYCLRPSGGKRVEGPGLQQILCP